MTRSLILAAAALALSVAVASAQTTPAGQSARNTAPLYSFSYVTVPLMLGVAY